MDADKLAITLRTTADYLAEAANILEGKGFPSLASMLRSQVTRAETALSSAASAPIGLAQGHTEEASVRRETSK